MKRVYTDERFPGFEIANHGTEVFEVYEAGTLVNRFVTAEGPVNEATAARRAADYFDRRALYENGPLDLRQPTPEEMTAADYTDPDSTNTTRDIDRLMALERRATDVAKKAALRRKILGEMPKEESLAAAVVAHLVET
jgi:hypothetical protein